MNSVSAQQSFSIPQGYPCAEPPPRPSRNRQLALLWHALLRWCPRGLPWNIKWGQSLIYEHSPCVRRLQREASFVLISLNWMGQCSWHHGEGGLWWTRVLCRFVCFSFLRGSVCQEALSVGKKWLIAFLFNSDLTSTRFSAILFSLLFHSYIHILTEYM